MKKIAFIILLFMGFIFVSAYFSRDDQPSGLLRAPCKDPITYQIGTIDPIYDITKQELKTILNEINKAWSKTIRKELFRYSEEGSITIRINYSDSQRLMNQEKSALSRIKLKKTLYRNAHNRLKKLKKEHEQLKKRHDLLFEQYKKQANGSYTKEEAENIVNDIKEKRKKLKYSATTINLKVAKLNESGATIDKMIADYNKNFGDLGEFSQGNYKQKGGVEEINIYGYDDIDELKLLLAHEMGHALGLKHVENSRSVMYYLMENQEKDSLYFTDEDIAALQNKCR